MYFSLNRDVLFGEKVSVTLKNDTRPVYAGKIHWTTFLVVDMRSLLELHETRARARRPVACDPAAGVTDVKGKVEGLEVLSLINL